MKNLIIRLEEEKDYRRVEEVTKSAFAYPERIERGQIGCPYEHWMVNELRKRDGILSLNSHLRYYQGFNNCYILLQKSHRTLENTKVFVDVFFITSCIVLYHFILDYDL